MTANVETALVPLSEAEMIEMNQLGIVRQPIDSYRVGNFRYSQRRDAIAQAKRQLSISLGGGAGSRRA